VVFFLVFRFPPPKNICLFVWWFLTQFSTIFKLHCGGQFYWWRKPDAPEKTTNLVASHWQTLSHNVVHLAVIEITDRHDIVESGVKHHQTNKLILLNQMLYLLTFYFET
jgi:hypothetical protein